jgi:hypothetical protein
MTSIIKVDQIQNAAGTAGLTIDSGGRVTLPYQPAFKARKNTSQTTTTNNEVITFTVETFDQGNNFLNSIFTCPVDGVYFFSCQWLPTNSTIQYDVRLLANTNTFLSSSRNAQSGGHETVTVNHVGPFTAGDTVKVVASSSGSVVYGDGDNWSSFMGYLIG